MIENLATWCNTICLNIPVNGRVGVQNNIISIESGIKQPALKSLTPFDAVKRITPLNDRDCFQLMHTYKRKERYGLSNWST